MRKHTARRRVAQRAKTRRGGMNNPPPPYNDLPPYTNNHPPIYSNRPPIYTNPSSNMQTHTTQNAQNADRHIFPNVNPVEVNHNKINSFQDVTYHMKIVTEKPELFDMQHAMERLQNMGSKRLGNSIKFATNRIAESTRDFIMSIYEENETFMRENKELRRTYENFKDYNNNDYEGEQPVAINYMWLYNSDNSKTFTIKGYLYLITTSTVYRSLIDIRFGMKQYTPNPFQKIYQFEGPESEDNVRGNVLVSYCKNDIELWNVGSKMGYTKKDINMFCIKLESIFLVFYNPFPPDYESAKEDNKMGRMISPHPGMTENESIVRSLLEQQAEKDSNKRNENNGYIGKNDSLMYPWTYKGQNVFRTHNGHVWTRKSNNESGVYMGKYNKATKILDTSAVNPYED